MRLYDRWCESNREDSLRKHFWTYVEKAGGRDAVHENLVETIRSHYVLLEIIADDMKRLGYEKASELLRNQMPQRAISRSGDLGEILATELVEEEIGHRVPVRRLRYKDGRDMAMRGDDIIGVGYDSASGKLRLLKGEAKSRERLDRDAVDEACKVLNRDHGRCTPDSLQFVANRLLESGNSDDQELGRVLRDESVEKTLGPDHIGHMIFTLSGNGPHASLKEALDTAASDRDNYVVNVHVPDHQEFIATIYEKAENLGND